MKKTRKETTDLVTLPTADLARTTPEWLETLASEAADEGSVVETHLESVSTRGGVFSFRGKKLDTDSLEVVVLAAVNANTYYEGVFDPDNPQSPKCYAVGIDRKTMKPNCQDPVNSTCEGCPNNKFGSAVRTSVLPNGSVSKVPMKGKACKNTIKLGMVLAGNLTEDSAALAEVFTLNVSTTNMKHWSAYIKNLTSGLVWGTPVPAFAVVTRVTISPSMENQILLSFKSVSILPQKIGETLKTKRAALRNDMLKGAALSQTAPQENEMVEDNFAKF